MTSPEVFIVAAARTPVGAFLGGLAELTAPQLGAAALKAALERARLAPEQLELTCLGNVISAGVGQAPGRQAALAAGIPDSVPALTVNKMCGSGLEAVITAARAIRAGDLQLAAAGGMESMSQAPYLLPRARSGYRLGHGVMIDAILRDGLRDAYGDFHMGEAADRCAAEHGISRAEQDAFARGSYLKARASQNSGASAAEIVAVRVPSKRGEIEISQDEEPSRRDLDKLADLPPAFSKDGTVTAANASKLNDAGAAVILASEAACREHNLKPLARIVGYAHHAQAPALFPTAPAYAIEKALTRAKLNRDAIDLYEINEAFAVVALACQRLAHLDPNRINIRGGAIALGHAIGASGARILTTLLYAMLDSKAKHGLATLCIGGGEANALILERV